MRIVSGVLKDYAWGRHDGLVPWCAPTAGPQAELWFGAHPSGPSPVIGESGVTLADVDDLAGLPMVKLLAAAAPLSLQVHPDARRAAEGFAAQQDRPRADWLFADDAEKSEMLLALSAFDTHAGWRDPQAAAALLAAVGLARDTVEIVAHGTRTAAVRAVLEVDDDICARAVPVVASAAREQGWDRDAVAALERVAAQYPGDRGVLVTVLLQHHRLVPGQALVVPAGVVHSYVEGLAVEVMTSSDNVLRLGLTPKTVAVDEALGAVREDREPLVLVVDGLLQPVGMPFAVQVIDGGDTVHVATGAARMVVAVGEGVTVDGVPLPRGAAAVFGAHEAQVDLTAAGRAVLVRAVEVPVAQLPG